MEQLASILGLSKPSFCSSQFGRTIEPKGWNIHCLHLNAARDLIPGHSVNGVCNLSYNVDNRTTWHGADCYLVVLIAWGTTYFWVPEKRAPYNFQKCSSITLPFCAMVAYLFLYTYLWLESKKVSVSNTCTFPIAVSMAASVASLLWVFSLNVWVSLCRLDPVSVPNSLHNFHIQKICCH